MKRWPLFLVLAVALTFLLFTLCLCYLAGEIPPGFESLAELAISILLLMYIPVMMLFIEYHHTEENVGLIKKRSSSISRGEERRLRRDEDDR